MNYAVLAIVALLLALYLNRMRKIRSLKQYSAAELTDLMKSHNAVVVLDVRTAPEHHAGAIKGSVHIPLQTLRGRLGEMEKYKGKEIVCYCQSGSRSASAALLLKKSGFSVANLRGGMGEWSFAHR